MKLLLDTHVLLWWMAGNTRRVSKPARKALTSADTQVVISATSIWEIAIKRGLGKLQAPTDLLERLEAASVELLPITARHADHVAKLGGHHRDPFDRLLIAQAEVEELTVVTADKAFRDYAIKTLW